ncbi:MAG: quinolinate synthase NadA [Thiohalomonadales bacterium]
MEALSVDIGQETKRLFEKLGGLGWTLKDCETIAATTLEINNLKKKQNTVILAHSYQSPDIMYGVGDFVGDSYDLSIKATKHPAQKIIFCSVYFMAETAKLLNPDKEVLVPRVAGCSLADAINAKQVRELRKQFPDAGIVCYINTYAEVKAECDACCTSSNVVAVVEAMPQHEIVFIPDKLMGLNLQNMTSKKIITWDGTCIVHESFDPDTIKNIRQRFPGVKILAHPECAPELVALVDFAGGTAAMLNYVRTSSANSFMLVTECGLTDRFKAEIKNKEIVGTCLLCPYMKEIQLDDILKTLKQPSSEQFVHIDKKIADRARTSLDKMFELESIGKNLIREQKFVNHN